MATFVEVTPDPFAGNFSTQASGFRDRRADLSTAENEVASYFHHVRRPVRGIQIKDDTYATLQVLRSNGEPLPLFDAASSTKSGMGPMNSNFLVQSVQESRAEKQQIILTFGEPYIFFFGEQPRIIQVSGVLLNTEDFNWRAEWWENYNLYLRGTACVRSRSRVYLSWDDIIVEGYVMSASAVESSTEQNYVRFDFQMFLTNYQNVSNIGKTLLQDYTSIDMDNPSTEFIDSLGTGRSSTLEVRTTNIEVALASGRGKKSLLSTLRSQAVAVAFGGPSRLLEVNGQVLDLLAEAGKFISTRNIRVPIGWAGSSVFDDAQVALASVDPKNFVNGDNTISLGFQSSLAGKNFNITGSFDKRWEPLNPGIHTGQLYDNTDEFVARLPAPNPNPQAPELYRDQKALVDDPNEAVDRAAKAFQAFGIETDPPSEVRSLIARAAFGIASIPLGIGLKEATSRSGTARFLTNLL